LADLTTPSLRSGIPLATSPLESGSPRVSTPGTCRPCAFSTLRRFPPPAGLLALFHASTTYGIQRAWTISPGVCSVSRCVPALRPAHQLAAPKRNLESERGTLAFNRSIQHRGGYVLCADLRPILDRDRSSVPGVVPLTHRFANETAGRRAQRGPIDLGYPDGPALCVTRLRVALPLVVSRGSFRASEPEPGDRT